MEDSTVELNLIDNYSKTKPGSQNYLNSGESLSNYYESSIQKDYLKKSRY